LGYRLRSMLDNISPVCGPLTVRDLVMLSPRGGERLGGEIGVDVSICNSILRLELWMA